MANLNLSQHAQPGLQPAHFAYGNTHTHTQLRSALNWKLLNIEHTHTHRYILHLPFVCLGRPPAAITERSPKQLTLLSGPRFVRHFLFAAGPDKPDAWELPTRRRRRKQT